MNPEDRFHRTICLSCKDPVTKKPGVMTVHEIEDGFYVCIHRKTHGDDAEVEFRDALQEKIMEIMARPTINHDAANAKKEVIDEIVSWMVRYENEQKGKITKAG